jgi:hypothetical protein
VHRNYRALVNNTQDLEAAVAMPDHFWAATSAPLTTMNADRVFLSFVDGDGNGRIMSQDVRVACAWALAALADRTGLENASLLLRLASLDRQTEEGRTLEAAARRILARLGMADGEDLSLSQVREIRAALEAMPVTQAGIVLPDAVSDPQVQQFIRDVIAIVGGVPHPSGQDGIDTSRLDAFLGQARAYMEWKDAGKSEDVLPFGERTADLYGVVLALTGPIESYFAQCRLEYQRRIVLGGAQQPLSGPSSPDDVEQALAFLPIAAPRVDRRLLFEEPLNPAYEGSVAILRSEVIPVVLRGPTNSIVAEDWERIRLRFLRYREWLEAKPGDLLDAMPDETVRRYLDEKFAHAVSDLRERSSSTSLALEEVKMVEKLILYQGHLLRLVNNFVSFPHLYDPGDRAIFETGTLVMDGRSFSLCLPVDDLARHSGIAARSRVFVLYLEIQPAKDPAYKIAVPITNGVRGNLYVGKRGVFRDLGGSPRNAQVVQLIDNPISLREAIAAPFRRLGELITARIEHMSVAGKKQLDAAIEQPQVAEAPAQSATGRNNVLLGGSVAVAALGSATAFITKTLSGLRWTTILAGVAGAVGAFLLPATILALVRLRRRELAPILEASGWALNARMRMTRRERRLFARLSGKGGNRALTVVVAAALVGVGVLIWLFWTKIAG